MAMKEEKMQKQAMIISQIILIVSSNFPQISPQNLVD